MPHAEATRPSNRGRDVWTTLALGAALAAALVGCDSTGALSSSGAAPLDPGPRRALGAACGASVDCAQGLQCAQRAPGGMCVGINCGSDADCGGEGARCVPAAAMEESAETTLLVCVLACTTSADCGRPEYGCDPELGVCLPQGQGAVGDACGGAGGAGCQRALACVKAYADAPAGECRAACDASGGCPDGQSCATVETASGTLGVCLVGSGRGPGGTCGDLLTSRCGDGLVCARDAADSLTGVCRDACAPGASVCASGGACIALEGGGGACAEPGSAGAGEGCGSFSAPCAGALVCTYDAAGAGVCRPPCDACADLASACGDPALTCAPLGAGAAGVCLPAASTGGAAGALCSAEAPCGAGLSCQAGVCARLCTAGCATDACAAHGERCVPAATGPYGFCLAR